MEVLACFRRHRLITPSLMYHRTSRTFTRRENHVGVLRQMRLSRSVAASAGLISVYRRWASGTIGAFAPAEPRPRWSSTR